MSWLAATMQEPMYRAREMGAPSNSARSSWRRVRQGQGAPHPAQVQMGRTGPCVVMTPHRASALV